MYTEQDIHDVLHCQSINAWIATARRGEQGQVSPTAEFAIRAQFAALREPLTTARLAAEVARYERGKAVNAAYALVASPPHAEATEDAGQAFRAQRQIVGPILWVASGAGASGTRYICYGLRSRAAATEEPR